MIRFLVFIYGLSAYVIFFGTLLYAMGFVGNVVVPKSIDSGAGGFALEALLINALLLALFAIQHSGMARVGFKQRWTKIIPVPLERSTYVLLSSLSLILLFWQWRPMTETIWQVENAVGSGILTAVFWLGWLLVLGSSFMVSHADLFGLRQVSLYATGKEYRGIGFKTPMMYKYVRHPLYLGFLAAFWSAPRMTLGHLLFSVVTTGYILTAIQFEERDMLRSFGDAYRSYKGRTPMLLPGMKRSK